MTNGHRGSSHQPYQPESRAKLEPDESICKGTSAMRSTQSVPFGSLGSIIAPRLVSVPQRMIFCRPKSRAKLRPACLFSVSVKESRFPLCFNSHLYSRISWCSRSSFRHVTLTARQFCHRAAKHWNGTREGKARIQVIPELPKLLWKHRGFAVRCFD
jgi:hypothetical protein